MFGNYENVSNAEIASAINNWINGRNAERDRKILYRRLIDGVCYEALAEEFDLSTRQVKNIVYKREYTVFKHLFIWF